MKELIFYTFQLAMAINPVMLTRQLPIKKGKINNPYCICKTGLQYKLQQTSEYGLRLLILTKPQYGIENSYLDTILIGRYF